MNRSLLPFRSGRVSVPCASQTNEVKSPARRFATAALFACLGALGLFQPAAQAIPTVYTIGDSTVASYTSGYFPLTGWGQTLPYFFDTSKVAFSNKAVAGTSSKSFYNSYWSGVKSLLKAGDFVFIQFGINDSATDTARHTDPYTTFEDYLTKFCNETKSKGATPILVTTIPRNAWNSDGTVYNAYHDYPPATRDAASKNGVKLVDLDQQCKSFMQSLGQYYCTWFIYDNYQAGWWPNYPNGRSDNVHLQWAGATEVASMVTSTIQSLGLSFASAVRTRYTVSFYRNNSNAGYLSRTRTFPPNMLVVAQALPNSGYSFSNWSGSLTGTDATTTFTMGTASKSITGNFK